MKDFTDEEWKLIEKTWKLVEDFWKLSDEVFYETYIKFRVG